MAARDEIITIEMTYTDYVNLKDFLEEIGEFNFPLNLDTIANLRKRALNALDSIF